jgi:hypothetical protein
MVSFTPAAGELQAGQVKDTGVTCTTFAMFKDCT